QEEEQVSKPEAEKNMSGKEDADLGAGMSEQTEKNPAGKAPKIEMDDVADNAEIVSQKTASAAENVLAKLASNIAIERTPDGRVRLEDIVKGLLRPMLREWLDTNLSPISERLVKKELEKISERALDKV